MEQSNVSECLVLTENDTQSDPMGCASEDSVEVNIKIHFEVVVICYQFIPGEMSIRELKIALKSMGLDYKGSRCELIDRLTQASLSTQVRSLMAHGSNSLDVVCDISAICIAFEFDLLK